MKLKLHASFTHQALLAQPLRDVEKHVSAPEHPFPLGYQIFQSLRRARADSQDEIIVGDSDLLVCGTSSYPF